MRGTKNQNEISKFVAPILLASLVAATAWIAIGITRDALQLKNHLMKAKSAISGAPALVKGGDLERGEKQLLLAQSELLLAKKYLNKRDMRLLAYTPIAGSNIKAVEGITVAGEHSVRAALELASVYRQLEKTKDGWRKSGRINSQELATKSCAHLEKASVEAKAALQKERNQPNAFLLPPIAEAKTKLDTELAQLNDGLDKGKDLCKALPNLLGENGRHEYFIAVQNNAELRATGGWIGIYGILSVDHGAIDIKKFDNIHTLMNADAVKAAAENRVTPTGALSWLNVNMVPDFPTSAERIETLYERSTGRQVDGVIGVDPIALSHFLKAVGPIKIPGLNEEITQENAVKWTMSDAYQEFDSKAERKGTLKFLAENVWKKVMKGEFASLGGMAKAFQRSVTEKHLMVFVNDSSVEDAIKAAGLGGELRNQGSDSLLVDVENCSALGNKLDYYLKESIRYSAKIAEDGSAKITAHVTLKNEVPKKGLTEFVTGKANANLQIGTNETFVSVFAPKGANLINTSLDGKHSTAIRDKYPRCSIFSIFSDIPPGEEREFRFDYTVAKAARRVGDYWDYSLLIQKQPLINNASYTVELSFPGHQVIDGNFNQIGSSARATGSLATDVLLQGTFQ